jgi:hypothetical protein
MLSNVIREVKNSIKYVEIVYTERGIHVLLKKGVDRQN